MIYELLHLFFGFDCPACGRKTSGGIFCSSCANAQETLVPPYCNACGIPVPHEGWCGRCLQHPPPFDAAFSALPYEGPIAWAVRRGKYGPRPWVFGRLSTLLAPLLQEAGPGCVVPMPCTKRAWKARGFSPTVQLCRGACRELDRRDYPITPLLRRREGRPPQAQLSLEERKNLSAAEFELAASPAGKRILLVDDVMTTQATARAAAAALRKGGASEIIVITLCRTL